MEGIPMRSAGISTSDRERTGIREGALFSCRICRMYVFHAMKNGSAVHGIHFYYGDEPKPDDSFFKPKRRRKVRCTETGVVYESIKDAAERTKISPNGIGSAASGMAGGYHWEYADD